MTAQLQLVDVQGNLESTRPNDELLLWMIRNGELRHQCAGDGLGIAASTVTRRLLEAMRFEWAAGRRHKTHEAMLGHVAGEYGLADVWASNLERWNQESAARGDAYVAFLNGSELDTEVFVCAR